MLVSHHAGGAGPALVQDLMTLLEGTMGAAGSRQDFPQQLQAAQQQQQPQLQPQPHQHARSTGP